MAVYIRAQDSNAAASEGDGQRLMADWGVESTPGARDGVVLLVNLNPKDPRHGHYAIVAGAYHYDGGALPRRELDRIVGDMEPALRDGRLADGLALGLNEVAHNLTFGPRPAPRPGAVRRAVADLTCGPFSPLNVIALLASVALGGWLWRRWGALPPRPRVAQPPPVAAPPDELSPGLAGALAVGNVTDAQLEATLLDWVRRGYLAIEPDARAHRPTVQLRRLQPTPELAGYEAALWTATWARADAEGVVAGRAVRKLRAAWADAKQALRAELEGRGWFATDLAPRQRPYLLAGFAGLALGTLAGFVAALGAQPWGLAAVALLGGVALYGFVLTARVPHRTPAGAAAAAPWRAYAAGLPQLGERPELGLDLDVALPYAVGLGVAQSLNERLKRAGLDGDAPARFGMPPAAPGEAAGFYPYWIAFHGSVAPSANGAAAAGAGVGSGAAGGSF